MCSILDAPSGPSGQPLGSQSKSSMQSTSTAKLTKLKQSMGDLLANEQSEMPFAKMLKGLDIVIRIFELDEDEEVLEILRAKKGEIMELLEESQDLV